MAMSPARRLRYKGHRTDAFALSKLCCHINKPESATRSRTG